MKKRFIFLFMLLAYWSIGQEFPKEMKLSADGTRLIIGGHATTGFYNESKIRVIELTFSNDNFWAEITAAGDNDLMANVVIDGEAYDSVGVRFKGQTSDFRNDSEKKSFNISMDAFIDGQDVRGYETLNLNGNYEDPSSIREILFNHIGRNYTTGLKTNFAQLYINGTYWGPYENVQQLNGEYLEEWFLSNDGTRWRALAEGVGGGPGGGGPRPGGGGPGGGGPGGMGGGGMFGQGMSTLNYLGADTSSYIPNYELKRTEKTNPWEDLVVTTDKLNNLPTDNNLYDNLKDYLDIDKALWFMAHENIFTDSDGYLSKGGMDYYVYWEAETGRIIPLEYDGNSVMNFRNTTVWTPFYRADETDFPLANRLLASPELRQRYLAHYRVVLEDYFTPENMDALIDNYAAQIRESIQNDSKRIYEPAEFEAEIINLKNHVRARRDFLLANTEIDAQGVTIGNLSTIAESPKSGESVTITATVDGEVDDVRLYYGSGLVGTFDSAIMTADGNGTYSATIPGFSARKYVRYYVEAIANNAANTTTYAPRGAEHDVYVYRVNVGELAQNEVVINEFMASNDASVADQDGEFDDWIELYNNTDNDIDLTGYFLSDNADNLDKYDIPDGTIIPANGYLIVWADEDGMQEGLHANFKLSASGEELFFLNSDTIIIDEITFGEQTTDQSFSRVPNGTGNFDFTAPTFNTSNGGTTSIESVDFETSSLTVYPNPASDWITIELKRTALVNKEMEIQLFDVYGRLTHQQKTSNNIQQIPTSHLANGLYFIVVNGLFGKKILAGKR